MSSLPTDLRTTPVTLRQVLGLSAADDQIVWLRIHATQLAIGGRPSLFLLVGNLAGAAAVATLFAGRVPLEWLAGWSVVVATLSALVTARRWRSAQFDGGHTALKEVHHTAIEGLVLAVAWGIAPLAFGAHADTGTILALWMVLSVLMTGSAMAMARLALATTGFIMGLSLAVTLSFIAQAAYLPAAATVLVAALLVIACVGRARTLVQLRHAELVLAERDQTVSLLLGECGSDASDWLWDTDRQRRLHKVTPRFAAALGRTPDELEGLPLLQALAGPAWDTGAFSPELRMLADAMKRRESIRDLPLPITIGEEQRWWSIGAKPRTDQFGAFAGFRGVGSDITEQRASADKINRMARFDTLTGLPNRLLVDEALASAMSEAERWGTRAAFMMIDLDRFKAVNDTFGHPIGDQLLGRVAERLGKLMTENELIGRLGGDEFAVVINNAADGVRVEELARTIIDTLSQPYHVDQHTLYIGASVGIATSPRDGRTAETLIRSADLALYRSKNAGGGVFHAYEPQLLVEAEERRILEIALRSALENGEMHLDYQPIVDAGSERLVGFEALLRWRSAALGVVSPDKFIPLATDARLMGPIGEWAVRAACAEAANWPDGIRVAVNVSSEQLHDPQFITVVTQALTTSQLAADRLELEVTENVFIKNGTGTIKVLEQILDLGVRLSLDDFGTGYSSLNYLSGTRFTSIKIDSSFVKAAAYGVPEAGAIIRAAVALAGSLGMATTAEGVETAEQLAMIRELGCSTIQGFYFGRPLPVAEARAIARRTSGNARVAA